MCKRWKKKTRRKKLGISSFMCCSFVEKEKKHCEKKIIIFDDATVLRCISGEPAGRNWRKKIIWISTICLVRFRIIFSFPVLSAIFEIIFNLDIESWEAAKQELNFDTESLMIEWDEHFEYTRWLVHEQLMLSYVYEKNLNDGRVSSIPLHSPDEWIDH